MGLVWGIAELKMREIQAYHLLLEDLLWRRYDLHLGPTSFILFLVGYIAHPVILAPRFLSDAIVNPQRTPLWFSEILGFMVFLLLDCTVPCKS
jgi:hypothetical protein